MRLLLLFLRTRQTGIAILTIAAVGVFIVIAHGWLFQPSELGRGDLALIPVALLFPLISASVIAIATDSPIGELELTMDRSLPRLRSTHLAILAGVGVPSALGVAAAWDHADAEFVVLRNLAGLIGIALLSAWLIGGRLSWIPPLVFAMLSVVMGRGSAGEAASWAWTVLPGRDETALLTTTGLLIVGAGLLIWEGARTTTAD